MHERHSYLCYDHNDIVPFLQSLIRSKKLILNNNNYLVHYDSHADMSIPYNTSVKQWKDRHNIIELLIREDHYGISEFIIPLLYEGYFDHIDWFRPKIINKSIELNEYNKFINLLNKSNNNINDELNSIIDFKSEWLDGPYHFYIGDHIIDNLAKVTCKCNYYLDDEVLTDLDKLKAETVKPINISITTSETADFNHYLYDCVENKSLDSEDNSISNDSIYFEKRSRSIDNITSNKRFKSGDSNNKSWILDICLDYFIVSNPFLVELKESIYKDIIKVNIHSSVNNDILTGEFTFIITSVYDKLYYRQMNRQLNSNDYSYDIINKFNNQIQYLNTLSNDGLIKLRNQSIQFISDILSSQYGDYNEIDNQLDKYYLFIDKHIIQKFYNIISYLSKNSKDLIISYNLLLLLPHMNICEDIMTDNLDILTNYINSSINGIFDNIKEYKPPIAITIACSNEDGYTINDKINKFIKKVLVDKITTDFVSHWNDNNKNSYSMKVYDHEVDSIEKSELLFKNKKISDYL